MADQFPDKSESHALHPLPVSKGKAVEVLQRLHKHIRLLCVLVKVIMKGRKRATCYSVQSPLGWWRRNMPIHPACSIHIIQPHCAVDITLASWVICPHTQRNEFPCHFSDKVRCPCYFFIPCNIPSTLELSSIERLSTKLPN